FPFQVLCATTRNFGGPLGEPPALPFGGGSPGAFAGATAFGLRCTVPSGATERMSSSVLFELNVSECGPITNQVTEPPTGMWILRGPNCVISASCTLLDPAPAGAGLASTDASVFWPAANCALGLGTDDEGGSTTTLPVIPSRCNRHMK